MNEFDRLPLDQIDVSDPDLYLRDSWRPYFARLRQEAPLNYCRESRYGPYWSVSSYDLINQVELNHAQFSSRADLGGIQVQDIAKGLDRPSFFLMDPPDHTGRRRTVAPMTNRGSLQSLAPLIRERTVEVLEGLPRGDVFDWVENVSQDLTSRMLATMFDYPQERRAELAYWAEVATANTAAPDPLVANEEERYSELQRMADAFAPLWREREDCKSGFDLITMLANGDATKDMNREEFIGTLFLLIVGGMDTTRNSMTGGLMAFNDSPDEYQKLRAQPDLVQNAVHEIIRYQTPLIHMRRTCLEDTELAGQAIAKGDKVVMWYISANRDETMFPDAEAFQIERTNSRRHLAFGAGIHRCVGDQLAILQLRTLWEEILDRGMEIEIVDPPERVYSNFVRGIARLPVKIIHG